MVRLSMRTFCSEAQHMHCNLHDGDHELASSYHSSRARKIVSSSLALKQRKCHERPSSKEEIDDRYDKQEKRETPRPRNGKGSGGERGFHFHACTLAFCGFGKRAKSAGKHCIALFEAQQQEEERRFSSFM